MAEFVEIEVDVLVTCAVAIRAEPGDSLMIVNGTCIGWLKREWEEKQKEPPSPAAQPKLISATDSRILRIIQSEQARGKPIHARGINAKYGLSCRHEITRLLHKRLIQRHPEDSDRRIPRYIVAPIDAQEPER